MGKSQSKGYFKQKLVLYFDENFPRELVNESVNQGRGWDILT